MAGLASEKKAHAAPDGFEPVAVPTAVATLAFALLGIQPIFVGMIADRMGLDLGGIGLLLSFEQGGYLAGALASFWLTRRFSPARLVQLFAFAALIASLATPNAGTVATLAGARAVFGLSAAACYSAAITVLARSRRPDGAYGIVFLLQTILWTVYAIALPPMANAFGYHVALGSAAAWFAVILLIAGRLPARARVGAEVAAQNLPWTAYRPAAGALLGMLLLQTAIFTQWGLLERAGQAAGLSAADVGLYFGIGLLGGVPGGLLPALLGRRFAPLVLAGAAVAVVCGASLGLAGGVSSAAGYVASIFFLNFGWVFGLSHYMGYASERDPDGTITRILAFAQALGSALGPLLVATLLARGGMSSIFLFSAGCAAAGFALALAMARRTQDEVRP